MLSKTTTTLAFAAACLTLAAVPAAQAQYYSETTTIQPQIELGDWSARRNVIASQRYDRLLQTNMGFRQARMRRECGPINDPQLRSQCLASFQQFEPTMTGSSIPPRRLRHRWEAGY